MLLSAYPISRPPTPHTPAPHPVSPRQVYRLYIKTKKMRHTFHDRILARWVGVVEMDAAAWVAGKWLRWVGWLRWPGWLGWFRWPGGRGAGVAEPVEGLSHVTGSRHGLRRSPQMGGSMRGTVMLMRVLVPCVVGHTLLLV